MREYRAPDRLRRVAVIGAGVVGLSCAWFLQERGVQVTVLDAEGPAAGASFGNAGWITPSLASPLPSPVMVTNGLSALFRPHSPVAIGPLSPGLVSWLVRFGLNSTGRRWERSMRAMAWINRRTRESTDALTAPELDGLVRVAPILASFTDDRSLRAFTTELEHMRHLGQHVTFSELSGSAAREACPSLTDAVTGGVQIDDQQFVDPGPYTEALAASVTDRGGRIRGSAAVGAVRDDGVAAHLRGTDGTDLGSFDAVVIAVGAQSPALLRAHGVRTRVQSGRGYSFVVGSATAHSAPLYFPTERIACTPVPGGMRAVGMMEFRRADAPFDPRRIRDLRRALARVLDLEASQIASQEWAGSRPCTPDGLPLIGATRSSRVHVAGGHGMWGVTHGSVTGRLLAEAMTTRRQPDELAAFDPLR